MPGREFALAVPHAFVSAHSTCQFTPRTVKSSFFLVLIFPPILQSFCFHYQLINDGVINFFLYNMQFYIEKLIKLLTDMLERYTKQDVEWKQWKTFGLVGPKEWTTMYERCDNKMCKE